MNPRKFLLYGGVLLVALGILGFIGVLGPAPALSIFGNKWWFDPAEAVACLLFGGAAIGALWISAAAQKGYAVVLGALSVLLGLYSVFVGPSFLAANLESPVDTVFALLFGAWGLFAGLRREFYK